MANGLPEGFVLDEPQAQPDVPAGFVLDEPAKEPLGVGGTVKGAADLIASGVAGTGEDILAGYAGMLAGRDESGRQDLASAVDVIKGVKAAIPDYNVGEEGMQVAQLVSDAYEKYVPEEIKNIVKQAQGAPEEVFARGIDNSRRLRERGYDTLADVSDFGAPILATATGAIPAVLEGVTALKAPAIAGRTAAATQKAVSPEKREIARQLERQALEGEYIPSGVEPTGTDVAVRGDPWTTGEIKADEDDLGLSGYTTTTAPYKLSPSGRVIDNPKHKVAREAGFSDAILGLIERANPETKAAYRKMVDSRERLYEMPEQSDKFDPTIVTGESLGKRLDVVKRVNKDAGKAIDKYVNNNLAKIEINTLPLMDKVSEQWGKKGVNLDTQTWDIDYGDMELNKKGQAVINELLDEMKEVTTKPTGRTVHNLKRRIDEDIAYGKNQTGLDAKTQGLLRDFRGSVKEFLENQFPEYGRANLEYSQTVDVIDRIQKAAGKVDLDGEYSMANLGRMSRAIMSQRISRDEIMTAIKDLDALSAAHGRVFKDDLRGQVHLANQIDDIWGPSRGTGFAGQSKQGTGAALAETAIDANTGGAAVGRKAIRALQKKQMDDKKKFKAMRELLKEGK